MLPDSWGCENKLVVHHSISLNKQNPFHLILMLLCVLLTAACCSSSRGEFAVLARLSCSDGVALTEQDGVILLFDAENPNPVSSWSVKKVSSAELLYLMFNTSTGFLVQFTLRK